MSIYHELPTEGCDCELCTQTRKYHRAVLAIRVRHLRPERLPAALAAQTIAALDAGQSIPQVVAEVMRIFSIEGKNETRGK